MRGGLGYRGVNGRAGETEKGEFQFLHKLSLSYHNITIIGSAHIFHALKKLFIFVTIDIFWLVFAIFLTNYDNKDQQSG